MFIPLLLLFFIDNRGYAHSAQSIGSPRNIQLNSWTYQANEVAFGSALQYPRMLVSQTFWACKNST